jgi:hypothetical protein
MVQFYDVIYMLEKCQKIEKCNISCSFHWESFDPKTFRLMGLKIALKGFKLQFSKLGPAITMTLQVDSPNFFHYESIKIDDK